MTRPVPAALLLLRTFDSLHRSLPAAHVRNPISSKAQSGREQACAEASAILENPRSSVNPLASPKTAPAQVPVLEMPLENPETLPPPGTQVFLETSNPSEPQFLCSCCIT